MFRIDLAGASGSKKIITKKPLPAAASVRAFNLGKVERAVEDARRREAAEKEQRKAKRKFSRGTR